MEKISGEAINLDIGGLIHQDGSFLEHAVKLMLVNVFGEQVRPKG